MNSKKIDQKFLIAKKAYSRLRTVTIETNKLIDSIGLYDGGPVCALGELYAEKYFGMRKARRSQKAVDGWLENGRSVQVKAKEMGNHSLRSRYVVIKPEQAELIDDLLIVIIDDDGNCGHIGPVPMKKILHLDNASHRYRVHQIKDVWDSINGADQ